MTRHIIITGGAGYIGSHAVLAFQAAGWTPVVIDNLVTGIRANVAADIPFVQEDIANRAAVRAMLEQYKPQAIVHFAGSVVVPESVSNPLKYYHNNTAASLALLQEAVAAGVGAFLFSSTAAVYGIPETTLVTEQSLTKPINPYGMSKLCTEHMLRDAQAAYGIKTGILRYFNVAGADPQGRTGQSTPEATHLIKVACETATGKRAGLAVFGTDYDTPDGTCVRDYIHVSDLADAHVRVLDYLLQSDKSLTVNCGYGHGYSVREVLAMVQEVAGKTISIREEGRRAGDPPALIADNRYLLSLLSWKPQHNDLRIIVRTALDWEAKRA
jgi:UDP-glucose 4-epimerase